MNRTIGRDMIKAPVRIGVQVTIQEAREVMQMWGMRHLPVTDESDQLIGIVSERDFSRMFGSNLKGRDPISEIMTVKPYAVFPETSLFEVVTEMAESKIGSVIIINFNREVIGIFTTTDAIKEFAKLLGNSENNDYRVKKISDYLVSQKSA
ncbi:MAG: CBS domain-containing protein [Bdellovibrionota bacterium]|mgnify:CR=1 FL=1